MRENTLAAFRNAIEQGATALESDVWLTFDFQPVLVHDHMLRNGLRRKAISATLPSELPSWLPALDDVYRELGTEFDLSLDVKTPEAAWPTIKVADRYSAGSRLWLCTSAGHVKEMRPFVTQAHLVVSTSLRGSGRTMLDERIDEAAEAGADAVNLRNPEWSSERVQRCHDRGMLAFAWDVQQRDVLERMRTFGCDGIFSDHLTLLAAA
jgi:glycerophosphoryl diester phosphodiesterase